MWKFLSGAAIAGLLLGGGATPVPADVVESLRQFLTPVAEQPNVAITRQQAVIEKEYQRQKAELQNLAKRLNSFRDQQRCNSDYARLREFGTANGINVFPNPCAN